MEPPSHALTATSRSFSRSKGTSQNAPLILKFTKQRIELLQHARHPPLSAQTEINQLTHTRHNAGRIPPPRCSHHRPARLRRSSCCRSPDDDSLRRRALQHHHGPTKRRPRRRDVRGVHRQVISTPLPCRSASLWLAIQLDTQLNRNHTIDCYGDGEGREKKNRPVAAPQMH